MVYGGNIPPPPPPPPVEEVGLGSIEERWEKPVDDKPED